MFHFSCATLCTACVEWQLASAAVSMATADAISSASRGTAAASSVAADQDIGSTSTAARAQVSRPVPRHTGPQTGNRVTGSWLRGSAMLTGSGQVNVSDLYFDPGFEFYGVVRIYSARPTTYSQNCFLRVLSHDIYTLFQFIYIFTVSNANC